MQADTASSPERPSLLTLQLAQTWSCSGSSEQTASLRRKPQAQKSLFFNQALSELEELLTVWTQTSTLVWMFLHPELSSRELPPLQHPQTQTCWSCPSPGALTAAFSEEKSLQKTILQKIAVRAFDSFPKATVVPSSSSVRHVGTCCPCHQVGKQELPLKWSILKRESKICLQWDGQHPDTPAEHRTNMLQIILQVWKEDRSYC